jgi:hemolysin activation/secretion protein
MGGVYSVRGFFERVTINDIGVQGRSKRYTPDLAMRFNDHRSMRALVFADAASGSDNEPVRGPDNELSSVGFGLQVAHRLHFAAAYVF